MVLNHTIPRASPSGFARATHRVRLDALVCGHYTHNEAYGCILAHHSVGVTISNGSPLSLERCLRIVLQSRVQKSAQR